MLAPQRLAYKTHLRKDCIPFSQGKRLSILPYWAPSGNWESGLLIKSSRWELQFCGSLMDPCSFIMSGFVWTIWNKRTRNVPNARQNSIQILTSMRNVHSAKKKTQTESRCILCQWRAGRLQLTDHISLLKSNCVPYYVSIGQILEQKSSKKGVTWCPSIFFERTFLLWHLQVGCILPPNIAANQILRPVNSINHRSDEKPTATSPPIAVTSTTHPPVATMCPLS